VLGTDVGEQMRAMFEADLAASQLIRYDHWQRRRPDLRMQEAIARIWAYWL
jgi:cardiolipin synthase